MTTPRVVPVDQRVNEIEAEVVGLKVAVNAIDEKIDRQTQVITDVVRNNRPNSGTQIGLATLFLALVIFYNDLTARPLVQSVEHNKATMNLQIESLDEDILSIWHWLDKHEAHNHGT